jgi:hypothetical protein
MKSQSEGLGSTVTFFMSQLYSTEYKILSVTFEGSTTHKNPPTIPSRNKTAKHPRAESLASLRLLFIMIAICVALMLGQQIRQPGVCRLPSDAILNLQYQRRWACPIKNHLLKPHRADYKRQLSNAIGNCATLMHWRKIMCAPTLHRPEPVGLPSAEEFRFYAEFLT